MIVGIVREEDGRFGLATKAREEDEWVIECVCFETREDAEHAADYWPGLAPKKHTRKAAA